MAYALAITCGVVLVGLSIGCYLTRYADSPVTRALRRALLFVVPLFLTALLFSLHLQWLLATADIIKSSTTIGQIEEAIDRIRLPLLLHAVVGWRYAAIALAGLLLLALLPFVKPGTPCLGMGKRTAGTLGALYVAFTLLAASVFLGQGAAHDIHASVARLKTHVKDVVRKAATHKGDIEEAAREIVRGALIESLEVTNIQAQLDTVQASLSAAQDEIEPYREVLTAAGQRFGGDTLASDFADTWSDIRKTVNELHWNRVAAPVSVPDIGRSTWSTLRLYEASTELRDYKLSRPKEESSGLHDTIAKTFDIMYAAGGRPDLGSGLEGSAGHPLAPLVGSLVKVWYEPLKALSAAQAEALFDSTVVQRQSFTEAADAARAEVRRAIEPLKQELQPGLDEVARGLQRLRKEASRLPQSYRRFAENIYPERLRAFRSDWHRLLSFSTPEAARAATALRQQTENALDTPADPFEKHQRIAAFERTLQTVARQVDENSRYQALLLLEQQVLADKPGAHNFARFTKRQVESRLEEPWEASKGGRIANESLANLEGQSQLLETHRLAESGLLNDPVNERDPGARERILRHLVFDLEFVSRAIVGKYRPEVYTAEISGTGCGATSNWRKPWNQPSLRAANSWIRLQEISLAAQPRVRCGLKSST